MRLQFKEQDFQVQAVKAVVDCFAGGLTPSQVFKNILKVQQRNGLNISRELQRPAGVSSGYHLTIEMETGTGKTYTYIRTLYELHKQYGFSKFIVIVPSIAIREGVYKSFQVTQDHFQELYGQKINPFIYNSGRLHDIGHFASGTRISVMIINTQAFNACSADARRIYQELDQLGARKPIDIIAQTNPILIIDEPQSVEGERTLQSMQDFNPLFTLRYSATHKTEYNKIFRLDALDAYNKRLVKKIQVKGINRKGSTATGYLYLEKIILSTTKPPVALVEFEKRTGDGIQKLRHKLPEGADIYELSGNIPAYKNQTISGINGYLNKIVIGGHDLYPGEIVNSTDENSFRRIQIRECILSHLQKEQELFYLDIKVLSLFFIDSVEKYRVYDEQGTPSLGEYAKILEEEYNHLRANFLDTAQEEYSAYLQRDEVHTVHAGYFSIDKKGRAVDPGIKRGTEDSDDSSAYDLIMKDKERLLSFEEPVRFIFSHSALKEGWDNPNVFQICALKNVESGSHIRRRQEVGRGMRLCVNKYGIRLDVDAVGDEVHAINKLTVIASESYEAFASGLQSEMVALLNNRPQTAEVDDFVSNIVSNELTQQLAEENESKPNRPRKKPETIQEVQFDPNQLIAASKQCIDAQLIIDDPVYEVTTGELHEDYRAIGSQHQQLTGRNAPQSTAVYDIVGEIEALTHLTRRTIATILQSIKEEKFVLLHKNPEAFIINCSRLINEVRAGLVSTDNTGSN